MNTVLHKLGSRKFWAALIGVTGMILTALQTPDTVVVQVTAIIGAIGIIVGYMFAEAWTDTAHADDDRVTEEDLDELLEELAAGKYTVHEEE